MVEQPHDGRHESVQAAMLKTKKMKSKIVVDFLDVCYRVKRHLRNHAGRSCSLGLWCDHGRNRSVAVAQLFFVILGAEEWAEIGGAEIEIEHTSLGNHEHGHNGCEECAA
eukprot:6948064-Heterocapsa_arctica.AAC.1